MRGKAKMKKLLVVFAAVLALVVSVAPSALADQSFNVNVNGGAGNANGTISFKSKTKFTFDAQIKDIDCDGYGVTLHFYIVFKNGDWADTSDYNNGQGCGNNVNRSDTIERNKNIDYIQAVVCLDNNGPFVCNASNAKFNPFTN